MSKEATSHKFEIGKTYTMNVPPSWILVGTVMDIDDTHIYIKDGVYVESIGDGHSALGSIPLATDAKGLKDAVTKSYPIKDGFGMRKDAVLIHIENERDVTPLSRSGEATAIKRAGGR